jgi:hypothetical protein
MLFLPAKSQAFQSTTSFCFSLFTLVQKYSKNKIRENSLKFHIRMSTPSVDISIEPEEVLFAKGAPLEEEGLENNDIFFFGISAFNTVVFPT